MNRVTLPVLNEFNMIKITPLRNRTSNLQVRSLLGRMIFKHPMKLGIVPPNK
jgi:hypothetical protein